ncbi:hypothetical protein [Aurantimonas endophytica]|uniref:Uncharacterized protein n=1 Tax=Aurantimonas endophytica TaxID=1522175 RepID=A0A7W6MN06_9HYPH|nr:hypothetical protein [Aurantimonas endophytica]MBB4001382.1 hypothetical protein [Aurantimonas endophytica]MCO6402975.1 hypothetical protein [Aurantimonas endophytica]
MTDAPLTARLLQVREAQREAMGRLGLLHRPWVLLGGAPEPTMPADLLASHARIDINNSGLAAKQRGWDPADLTVRRPVESWKVFPDLETKALLWYNARPRWRQRWKLIRQRRAKIGALVSLDPDDREAINQALLGPEILTVGELGKPSTGIAALCYGLFLGVPEIVLSGFSFSRAGHSYDTLARPRLQIAEDRYALTRLREDKRVATSEPELAEDLGLRLWKP